MRALSNNEIAQINGGWFSFELHYTLDCGVILAAIGGSGGFVLAIATQQNIIHLSAGGALYGAILGGVLFGFPIDLYHHFFAKQGVKEGCLAERAIDFSAN